MAEAMALLFDLDGTLIDSVDLLLAAFHHAFDAHQLEAPADEQWIAGIGTPLAAQLRQYVSDEALLERVIGTYRTYQREHHDRLLREYDGARDTVALLKARGHPMALVTSKSIDLAHRALEYAGLSASIDVVVGLESTERHKPNPDPVLFALRALGAEASNAAFIGDSPHDMLAGNAAGVVTVAALWGPFSRQTLLATSPTTLAEHIRDIPGIIDRLARDRLPADRHATDPLVARQRNS